MVPLLDTTGVNPDIVDAITTSLLSRNLYLLISTLKGCLLSGLDEFCINHFPIYLPRLSSKANVFSLLAPSMRENGIRRNSVTVVEFDKFERADVDEATWAYIYIGRHKSRGCRVFNGLQTAIFLKNHPMGGIRASRRKMKT